MLMTQVTVITGLFSILIQRLIQTIKKCKSTSVISHFKNNAPVQDELVERQQG